jgi:hypothetical protein
MGAPKQGIIPAAQPQTFTARVGGKSEWMRWPEPWKRVPLLLTTQTKKPKRISRNLSATNALGAQRRWRQGSVGVLSGSRWSARSTAAKSGRECRIENQRSAHTRSGARRVRPLRMPASSRKPPSIITAEGWNSTGLIRSFYANPERGACPADD